jgi:hypothetical protein
MFLEVEPIYKTNNRLLRFFADNISSPIGHYFFSKALHIYFKYEKSYEEVESFVPPKFDRYRMKVYNWIYDIMDIPYSRWGTIYRIIRFDNLIDQSDD